MNLKGNPSFLLAGVTTKAAGKYGVVLRSKTANTAIPAILANTSLGVVNSKLVKAHGGTDKAGADKTDKAERWFNSPDSRRRGQRPVRAEAVLDDLADRPHPEPGLLGLEQGGVLERRDPQHDRADPADQHQAGLARDRDRPLRPAGAFAQGQLEAEGPDDAVDVGVLALREQRPDRSRRSRPTSSFQQAVRYALDYGSIRTVAGPGAIQAPGLIPSMFLGSLPQSAAVRQNVARAKSALTASGLGNQEITLEYPTDLTINGVSFETLAQRIQANLSAIGMNVKLAGSPVGTWLQRYRDGKMPFGLSVWGPDYPDPADYLVFLPGELVGTRAGWPAGSDPTLQRLGNPSGSRRTRPLAPSSTARSSSASTRSARTSR